MLSHIFALRASDRATRLGLSVLSQADNLFNPVARTSVGVMPSDLARIAEARGLPCWFLGGLCAVFSALVLVRRLRASPR